MALDTRELLARLIQCEAGGEGTAGMQAVATVIMNRATVDVEGNSPGSITAAMCGRSSRSRNSLSACRRLSAADTMRRMSTI